MTEKVEKERRKGIERREVTRLRSRLPSVLDFRVGRVSLPTDALVCGR